MKKVFLYSALLVGGLLLSQVLPGWLGAAHGPWSEAGRVMPMVALLFTGVYILIVKRLLAPASSAVQTASPHRLPTPSDNTGQRSAVEVSS